MTQPHGVTVISCLYKSPCQLARSLEWPLMRKFNSICSGSF